MPETMKNFPNNFRMRRSCPEVAGVADQAGAVQELQKLQIRQELQDWQVAQEINCKTGSHLLV
ncbi:MAG: hypothetical protein WC117_06840 [Sphaerochaetaceae bacterium]|jgi:hypothetical protein